MKYLLLAFMAAAFTGCASDGGVSRFGPDSKEQILNGTKLEGLYLFKIDATTNNISVNSHGDAEVKL